MKSLIFDCAKQFNDDVKSGKFPAEEEAFHLCEEELEQIKLYKKEV